MQLFSEDRHSAGHDAETADRLPEPRSHDPYWRLVGAHLCMFRNQRQPSSSVGLGKLDKGIAML